MSRFLLFFAIALLASCQNSPGDTQKKSAAAPAEKVDYYPSLPASDHQWIANNCDYIDYLYYELPMSMSFHEKASIVSAVGHISQQAAPKSIPCKSIGRISYQQAGEIKLEAEMYYAQGCAYFVFLKNNKPTYGNQMTQSAVAFYQNVFNQAKVTPK